ncbi:MAG TPA: PBP1A family penicillin-binding protein [Longimicrobiales bacterium]|nr:PBP1A family penicillin-binding protein [Longimicrobiales bacterium]
MSVRSTLLAPARWLRARPRLLAALVAALVIAGATGAGLALGVWNSVCRTCPSVAQIFVWEPKQSTQIFDIEGRLVGELALERRTPVAIETLPPHVAQAFIAVEDRRFYSHDGLDARGLVRGAFNLVAGRWGSGGGSTITQQLARNMFQAEVGFVDRLERKLKEMRVALELERVYEKDEILEAYINQINYGPGWWGIETAAQRYYGKPAAELDVDEAAMLAAVINRPGRYSPFRNPDLAMQRRNLVIGLMGQEGYLTREQVAAYRERPLPAEVQGGSSTSIAPYFVEWVRDELDQRYGNQLYEAGYKVYTTLDLEMQRRAVDAMGRGFDRVEALPGFRHPKYEEVMADGGTEGTESKYLQGMFVAMAPNGDIRALIGGRDFGDSKFNRATQALRQPGSVFKPFVYTAAIASDIPASHVVFDSPIRLEQEGQEPWSPRNYDGEFHGPTTMREGLRSSLNLVAVKVGLEVGVETVAQYAQRMGVETAIPRVPAVTIGAADVIPMQVVTAYAPLANGGARVQPRAIVRVEDAAGRVLWETEEERTQVLDTLEVAIVRDMLRGVVDGGTAYTVRSGDLGNLPYEIPAAGKTGTTNDATDVWFVGFTPDLIAGVWFGFDRPTKIRPGATGGVDAAPVWGEFMRSVYVGENALLETPAPWVLPEQLVRRRVDGESGKLATDWCPPAGVYEELYIPGTEPTEPCDLHGPGAHGGLIGQSVGDSLPDSVDVEVDPNFRF